MRQAPSRDGDMVGELHAGSQSDSTQFEWPLGLWEKGLRAEIRSDAYPPPPFPRPSWRRKRECGV